MAEFNEARMVSIPLGEYVELVRTAERVATVARMCTSGQYVSTGDIQAVLGIEAKEEAKE